MKFKVITRWPDDPDRSCNGGDYKEGYWLIPVDFDEKKGGVKSRLFKPYVGLIFFNNAIFPIGVGRGVYVVPRPKEKYFFKKIKCCRGRVLAPLRRAN